MLKLRNPFELNKILPSHVGNEQKKHGRILSMKYWLFNTDPYKGLLQSLYNWVLFSPIQPNQPGLFSLLKSFWEAHSCQLVDLDLLKLLGKKNIFSQVVVKNGELPWYNP